MHCLLSTQAQCTSLLFSKKEKCDLHQYLHGGAGDCALHLAHLKVGIGSLCTGLWGGDSFPLIYVLPGRHGTLAATPASSTPTFCLMLLNKSILHFICCSCSPPSLPSHLEEGESRKHGRTSSRVLPLLRFS